jgi:opacity protein-like surface antigen
MQQIKHAITIVSSLLLLFILTTTHAAMKDDISRTPHDWSGYYIGLNIGAINHTMDLTDTNATYFNATLHQVSDPRLAGGIQGGYRHQVDCNRVSAVYGLELTANLSDARFSEDYGSSFALYQLNSEHRLDALYLAQLTGGIAVDRALFFLAAGLSWVQITGDTTNLDSIVFSNSFSVKKNELGTALGGGIEYAITDKASIRLKVDVITPHTYSTSDNLDNNFKIANNIVQGTLGVNYTFA